MPSSEMDVSMAMMVVYIYRRVFGRRTSRVDPYCTLVSRN